MYRLYVSRSDNSKFGLDFKSNDFILESAEDVCNVIKSLSALKLVYTLTEISISTVDDVLDHFLPQKD